MNEHLKKFVQMMAEETEKVNKTKKEEVSEQTDVASYVANYLSNNGLREDRKDPIDQSIPAKNDQLISKSRENDDIPTPPKDIETQRWDDPLKPLDKKFVTFEDMNKHYTKFLSRIQQQMTSLSGGGEVNLRNLDDVDSSTIGPNKHLAYNPSTKKFFFESISGAEPQVQSDWSETDSENIAFIENKPPISYDSNNNSVEIESGNSLIVSNEIKNLTGNLSISTDNYLTLDSINDGQIEIGRNSGLGNVLIGNKTNGTNISVFGDIIFANSDLIADFAGSDIENLDTIRTIQQIEFDTTHNVSEHNHSVGTLCWDQSDQTLNLFHPNGVRQQIGQEQFAYALNNTGSMIPNGTVVRFDGVSTPDGEARIEIAPLLADGQQPGLYTIGVATQNIADGEDGKITVFGKVREIDTTGTSVGETWNIGDILYVSPTTPGNFTKVKPTAPNNVTPVAAVLRVDSTEGELFVRPTIEQKESYGRFARTTNFTFDSADTAYTIPFDSTEIQNGAELGSPTSRIVVDQSGFFQIDINLQADSSGGFFSSSILYAWLRVNGLDVPNSTRKHGVLNNAPSATFSYNIGISLDQGDYVEIAVATNDTGLVLDAAPATTFAPSTASALVSVTQLQL